MVNPSEEQPAGTAQPQPPTIQGIQPPTGLNLSGKDKAVNWKIYKQQWENYSIVAQLYRQSEDYRVALFLYSIGQEAVKTYNSFDMSEENRQKLAEIIKEFNNYAVGETNETYEHYIFNSREQKEGEPIDSYVAELRTLAQSCNFCTCFQDSLIGDCIVLGIRDGKTCKRLLLQNKLTLTKCTNIVKSDKVSKTQIQSMDQAPKQDDVHKVKFTHKQKQCDMKPENKKHFNNHRNEKPCDRCGGKHRPAKTNCFAYGKVCGACGMKNHFAKQCKSKVKTHQVGEGLSDTESSEEYLFSVTTPETTDNVNAISEREIYAQMLINEKPIKFHIDCGATVNVLPIKYVNSKDIKPSNCVLQMWNKTELKPEGTCRVTLRNPKNHQKYSIEFILIKENLTPLLGAKVIQQMGLIQVHGANFEKVAVTKTMDKASGTKTAQEIIEEYKDVFEGDLGTLEGKQHLAVDPTVLPNVFPLRWVPFAIKPKLMTELERLTDIGVLMPVDEPTDWASHLVIAMKESGDLRLCLDPKQLNKALKRERYPLPRIEDVLPDLSRAKVFTKVDARNGYWHMQFDDETSKLMTFDTPFRQYRWKYLPFGISVASVL